MAKDFARRRIDPMIRTTPRWYAWVLQRVPASGPLVELADSLRVFAFRASRLRARELGAFLIQAQ